jgi:hypothetical protein
VDERPEQAASVTTPDPQYVDDDHQAIAEFASAFLDEDEAESFVDHLMERRGYQRVHSWAPGDGGQGGDGGQDDGGADDSRGRGPAGARGRGPRVPASSSSPRGNRRAPYFKR